ncbi:MAG TPA: tRNA preQ1(34) S-adenosylmethionine ribosyltransferase-isomerase QueA [Thermodesulfovibrionales bacterium]|nr:tRNA preQ1(34) S-adenosylmethionine ribosyltransferase-isomerase QueA [Thermodesulfovibrionales bacterium]
MKVTDFDFDLPDSLIALQPSSTRDGCRLLILRRDDGSIEHRRFSDLPEFVSAGDLLLLNSTKVFPARMRGTKRTGGKLDILLVRELEPGLWEVLSKGRYSGMLRLSHELSGEVVDGKIMRFEMSGDPLFRAIWNAGQMPLPPYIKRNPTEEDREWYQTVYADEVGSIAAPTAGLHFTGELIASLEEKGVEVRFLTLHVGTGTFKPVKAETVRQHVMEAEYVEFDRSLIDTITGVKRSGKRVIAVGTTTTRAIEGYCSGVFTRADSDSREEEWRQRVCGYTDIFIYPGYEFKVVDALITNFHLPRSTPLMLTSAFSSLEKIMDSYCSAVSVGYRFFSYGDAMLIL